MSIANGIDLAASRCCMLSLIDAAKPPGPIDPAELGRWITHTLLPGSATVRVDGLEVRIPEGKQMYVQSVSMAYELVAS